MRVKLAIQKAWRDSRYKLRESGLLIHIQEKLPDVHYLVGDIESPIHREAVKNRLPERDQMFPRRLFSCVGGTKPHSLQAYL